MNRAPTKPAPLVTRPRLLSLGEDSFLRRFGFTIYARPNDGEAVWRWSRRILMGHAQALNVAKGMAEGRK